LSGIIALVGDGSRRQESLLKNSIDKPTGAAAAAIPSASTCESATNLTPAWTRVRICGARHGLFRAERGVGYLFVVQWSRSDAPHFNLGPILPH
jgi:hypothetical protein